MVKNKISMQEKLSFLWIFLMFNYAYCDILAFFEQEIMQGILAGDVGGIVFTNEVLLMAGLFMEIPIAMILISRFSKHGFNRWPNLIVAPFMALAQLGSLTVGTAPSYHYIFFSIVEIGCLVVIFMMALKWKNKK